MPSSSPSITNLIVVDVAPTTISSDEWTLLLTNVWNVEQRARINRYHKGAASPVSFDAKNHDDTRCFLFGRLLLQDVAVAAMMKVNNENGDGDDNTPQSLSTGDVAERVQISTTPEGKPFVSFFSIDNAGVEHSTGGRRRRTFFPNIVHAAASGSTPSLSSSSTSSLEVWNANVTHAGRAVACVWQPDGSELVGVDVMPVEITPWPQSIHVHWRDERDDKKQREGGTADSSTGTTTTMRSFWRKHTHQQDLEEFLSCFESYFTPREWTWIRHPSGVCFSDGDDTGGMYCDGVDNDKKKESSSPPSSCSSMPLTAVIHPNTLYAILYRFFVNWALKESYIKAIGIGLGLELQRAEFRIAPGVMVSMVEEAALPPQERQLQQQEEEEKRRGGEKEDDVLWNSPSIPRRVSPFSTCAASTSTSLHADSIVLYLDGVARHDWFFRLFDMPSTNCVGAVARGPLCDAVCKWWEDVTVPSPSAQSSLSHHTESERQRVPRGVDAREQQQQQQQQQQRHACLAWNTLNVDRLKRRHLSVNET